MEAKNVVSDIIVFSPQSCTHFKLLHRYIQEKYTSICFILIHVFEHLHVSHGQNHNKFAHVRFFYSGTNNNINFRYIIY